MPPRPVKHSQMARLVLCRIARFTRSPDKRLIFVGLCNQATGHYVDNIIVYAHLVA
jgi:hypothetical protein